MRLTFLPFINVLFGLAHPAAETYNTLAANIYEHGGQICGQKLEESFAEIERQLRSLNDSRLMDEFNICPSWNITNWLDVAVYSDNIINEISNYINSFQ